MKTELAQILGINENEIIEFPEELQKDTIIVFLRISRWRAKARLMTDDLAVSLPNRLYELGHKLLLPVEYEKELGSIETAARLNLAKWAFHTPFGHIMAIAAFPRWKKKNEEYRERFFALRDEICEKFAPLMDDLREQYTVIALENYKRLTDKTMSEDEYVEEFLARISALIPSIEEIRDSFVFDVRVSPVFFGAQFVRFDINDEIAAELQKTRDFAVEIIRDAIIELRTEVAQTVREAMNSIAKRGDIHPRTIVQLRNLADSLSSKEVFDRESGIIARRINFALATKDVVFIQALLREIEQLMTASVELLQMTPRAAMADRVAQDGDLPDSPSWRAKRARARLGLDIDVNMLSKEESAFSRESIEAGFDIQAGFSEDSFDFRRNRNG